MTRPADQEALRDLFSRPLWNDPEARITEAERRAVGTPRETEPRGKNRADYLSIKGDLLERLLDELGDGQGLTGSDEDVAEAVEQFVARVLESDDLPLNEVERDRLASELRDETTGVGPLAPLMADPAVTDVLVNGPDRVYVERFGRIETTKIKFRDDDHVIRVIERIAARVGRRIDLSAPMLDARLPDGSRVNATLPPISIDGPTLSIRRFGSHRLRRRDLLRLDVFNEAMLEFLELAVKWRASVLISGGTGAGKSTILGALAETIPAHERIVTIEDTAELVLDQDHVVRLETRPPNIEGRGQITARDLVMNSLRMRPDRVIVGEVRGGEAMDMLQAMNTGHDGSMSTIHANTTRDALARLETMVMMSGLELPSRAIREQIASAINLLISVRRFEDGVRRIESVAEVAGMEGNTILLNDIFKFERMGRDGQRVKGRFVPTGVVPKIAHDLRLRGVEMPMTLFQSTGAASDV